MYQRVRSAVRAPEIRSVTPAPCDDSSPPCGALQRPGYTENSRSAAAAAPGEADVSIWFREEGEGSSNMVNPSLRRLFISFNVCFVIVGGLIIIVSLALLSPSLDDSHGGHDHSPATELSVLQFEDQTTSHIVLYIVGSVTMAIAILGACGAHKENLTALTVFLVCMVIGCLLMLRAAVLAAVTRPELESVMEERWRSFLPLDQASDAIKSQAEALQTSLHCCGLFSHEDWEDNIPDSCLCDLDMETEMEVKCETVRYKNFLSSLFRQQRSVLSQNCLPLIMDSVETKADITLAVVFTLLVLALLGLSLCSLMIYQMFSTSDRPNTPLSVPVMFFDQPPAYQQLFDSE
ncbi:tetraspanin-3-like [Plectropomus leopardus]|uniref:tetraspanin-3-like n=1 Tax=Plectropomus leopardus TaxID=160734 RepID=UPI001C4C541F|nr:tetraspanin-3-like [Plectropomus leopardus]